MGLGIGSSVSFMPLWVNYTVNMVTDVREPHIRGASILRHLQDFTNPKMVEVGVWVGDLSTFLVRARQDLFIYLVDIWVQSVYTKVDDTHRELVIEKMEQYAPNRYQILHGYSVNMAETVPDYSLDLVFIDANHTYKECSADITAWFPKVKDGGWLSGHDYDSSHRGVIEAVQEFNKEYKGDLELDKGDTWFIRVNR